MLTRLAGLGSRRLPRTRSFVRRAVGIMLAPTRDDRKLDWSLLFLVAAKTESSGSSWQPQHRRISDSRPSLFEVTPVALVFTFKERAIPGRTLAHLLPVGSELVA
jgi:hypothetical protein